MTITPPKSIGVNCSESGAALKIKFPATDVTAELRARLEKTLGKKGVAVRWNDKGPAEVNIRVVRIDQGNQALRYLLPFIAPAVMEVEGKSTVAGKSRDFHYVQKAQMGLLGGSAHGMLKVCAQRIADKIAKDLLASLKA
jgi:hypothetical protein